MNMQFKKGYILMGLLVSIPTLVSLVIPLYNTEYPELFGIPFFYWFQTVWLLASSGFYLAFAHMKGKGS